MKQYISEGRAIYEDQNHGLFSKRLAEWAISNMEVKDETTKELKRLKAPTLDDTKSLLSEHNIDMPSEFLYTAWYLHAMSLADYPKTIKTDEQRASFIEETICDPDGMPENVLDCFVAKMCNADVPVFWEKYL